MLHHYSPVSAPSSYCLVITNHDISYQRWWPSKMVSFKSNPPENTPYFSILFFLRVLLDTFDICCFQASVFWQKFLIKSESQIIEFRPLGKQEIETLHKICPAENLGNIFSGKFCQNFFFSKILIFGNYTQMVNWKLERMMLGIVM